MLIYKLSRAPERRVFYIDTGNLPKAKAEQYVKGIADKYRTKVVYDAKSGEIKNDRKFNALTEDFWLPRSGGCFSMDTKVKLLDGESKTLTQLELEYLQGKVNWTYTVAPSGKVVPGKITWAGVTKRNTEVIDVFLDNGEKITCTPEHKFILRTGEKIRADQLTSGSSLMPINTSTKQIANKDYTTVQHMDTEEFEYTHRMVSNYFNGLQKKTEVIHHNDLNRFNNNPENLRIMDKKEHLQLHSKLAKYVWEHGNYEEHCENLSKSLIAFYKTPKGLKMRKEISKRNLTDKRIIDGLEKGRNNYIKIKAADKLTLPADEYSKKYTTYILTGKEQKYAQMKLREKYAKEREILTDKEFINKYPQFNNSIIKMKERHGNIDLYSIISIIKDTIINNPKASNITILENIKEVYGDYIKSIKALRKYLSSNGYESISAVIVRNIDETFIADKRKNANKINHKVLAVVKRTDTIDVGTITVDGNNEFHDYHNYALDAGVFVMNSKGTEISTLPGGQNSGDTEETEYFKDKLFNALGVPKARFEEQSSMFSGGTQITRDEIRFSRLIERLRTSFNMLFEDILGTQLILKNIISPEDWIDIKNKIVYKYAEDNYFKEAVALERMQLIASLMQQYDMLTGKWVSKEFVYKNVAMFTEDEIREIKEQIANEEDTSQEKEIRSRQNDLALTSIGAQEDELNNPTPPPAPPTVKAATNPPPKQNTAKRPGLTNTVEVSEAYDISNMPSLTEDVISEMF